MKDDDDGALRPLHERRWRIDHALSSIVHRRNDWLTCAIVYYTAVELKTGVFAGEETPVLKQSEV
jgi:hypothetical protein